MCVRYVGIDAREERRRDNLRDRFGDGPWLQLFPGSRGSFVNSDGEIVEATWGLQPFWAKDPKSGRKNAYNARSETVAEKPTFRKAFKERRCLVPAQAFYERSGESGQMHWLRIEPVHEESFLIAALWEEPNERTQGLPTYTLITTEPNELVATAHDRMPVMLGAADAEGWMDPKADLRELHALLIPCPPEWMRMEDAGPVSTKRKKANDEGENLL